MANRDDETADTGTVTESVDYAGWSATCDTLHAHAQVLGKLDVALAPPEPELAHAALRLTARGWETRPLPAPNGTGAFSVTLDLRAHVAEVRHSDGSTATVALTPDRPVGRVTREVLAAVAAVAGPVTIDTRPQEVPWSVALDADEMHATYDTTQVEAYCGAATKAALVLQAYRAPFFIMRNAMDAQEIAVGWWPGDAKYGNAAFYAYAHPSPDGFAAAQLTPAAARWSELGEFLLDWTDVCAADDPHAYALEFLNSAFGHACIVCGWDPHLTASMQGNPPPVR